MGSMMASFAEGLVLAKDTGLSQQDLLEATGLGAIAAPMFAMKVPRQMHQRRCKHAWRVRWPTHTNVLLNGLDLCACCLPHV